MKSWYRACVSPVIKSALATATKRASVERTKSKPEITLAKLFRVLLVIMSRVSYLVILAHFWISPDRLHRLFKSRYAGNGNKESSSVLNGVPVQCGDSLHKKTLCCAVLCDFMLHGHRVRMRGWGETGWGETRSDMRGMLCVENMTQEGRLGVPLD
jgi:hypothetical protein